MSVDIVNDIEPRVQYTALAAQTDFPYPFPIFADADLVVDVDGATQTLTTDYTVTGEGEDAGGTVTFVVAMTGGEIVTIWRDLPIERTTDFQQNGRFSSDSFNDELDRIIMVQQQLDAAVGRALRAPYPDTTASADMELPSVANRAEKFLYFNTAGDPEMATAVTAGTVLSQSTVGTALYTAQTASELAAGVTPTNPYYRPYELRRYGGTVDGVTNDGTAVRNWLLSASQAGALATYEGPAGTALCTTFTALDTTNDVRIFAPGLTIKGPAGATDFCRPGGDLYCEGVTFDRWLSVFERETADTGTITDFRVIGNTFQNCTGLVINVERPISNYLIEANLFDTCSGGYAIKIGANTYASQDTWVKGRIVNNVFKTLTASSTTSCAAGLIYGREVVITGNIVDGVQGADGEGWGFYTKCRYSIVTGNTIRNVSSTSASDVVGINIKGNPRSLTTAPQGFNNVCADNNLYNIGVSNSKGTGIRAQTDDITIHGNHIEDAGVAGIITDDTNGYSNTIIGDNFVVFTTSTGTVGVRIEGNGGHIQCVDNIIRNAITGVKVDPTGGALDSVRIAGNLIDADTVSIEITEDENLTNFVIESNVATNAATNGLVINAGAGTPQYWTVRNNDFRKCGTAFNGVLPANSIAAGNRGYVTENGGTSAAIASGATIAHGLSVTPTIVTVTAAESGPTDAYVSAVGASTFVVNFGGGGSKTFHWEAKGAAFYGY